MQKDTRLFVETYQLNRYYSLINEILYQVKHWIEQDHADVMIIHRRNAEQYLKSVYENEINIKQFHWYNHEPKTKKMKMFSMRIIGVL